MLSNAIGSALRQARTTHGISRAELAAQAGVSVRLVAEFERGQRPNVSLETALTLLQLVGLRLPFGDDASRTDVADARALRAARRRATWRGEKHRMGNAPPPPIPESAVERLAAVTSASRLVYAISDARHATIAEAQLSDTNALTHQTKLSARMNSVPEPIERA